MSRPHPTPGASSGPAPDTPRAGSPGRPFPVSLLVSSIVFSLSVGFLVAWFVVIRPHDEPAPVKVGDFVAGQPIGSASVTGRAKVGHPAPSVTFPALGGAGQVSLGAVGAGKVTVVNFWSSTCAPCVSEMPSLQAAHLANPDVAFVGIDTGDTASDGEGLATRTGVTYTLGYDHDAKVIAAFGGSLLPHTVVIDARGIVRAIHTGRLQGDDLQTMLASARS